MYLKDSAATEDDEQSVTISEAYYRSTRAPDPFFFWVRCGSGAHATIGLLFIPHHSATTAIRPVSLHHELFQTHELLLP